MRHCWGTTTMPHTRSGHDQDRSRNMRTRNRRLGPLVQHPPPPLPGRHNTTTSRKSTHNNTKGSGLNKPPQNPGFDTPAKGHCTRYVALHPLRRAAPVTSRCTRYVALHPNRRGAMPTHRVQCLHIGCTTPPSQAQMRTCPNGGRRTRQAWLRPAAVHPPQPTAPGGNEPQTANRARRQRTPRQPTGPGGAVQTAGWARGRQGLTGLRNDEPSGRLATQTTSGPPSARLAALRGIKPGRGAARRLGPGRGAHMQQARARRSRGVEAGARGTHTTNPGPGRAYDEAGTRRAKQRRGPRPRQQVRPGDPP